MSMCSHRNWFRIQFIELRRIAAKNWNNRDQRMKSIQFTIFLRFVSCFDIVCALRWPERQKKTSEMENLTSFSYKLRRWSCCRLTAAACTLQFVCDSQLNSISQNKQSSFISPVDFFVVDLPFDCSWQTTSSTNCNFFLRINETDRNSFRRNIISFRLEQMLWFLIWYPFVPVL